MAGAYATIVKLTRTTMIIPISIIFTITIALQRKKDSDKNRIVNYDVKKIFPWFIAASLLNTIGIFRETYINYINALGKFMVVMALSAVGLNSTFKKMIKIGLKPVCLGLIVWFTVTIVSITVQFVYKQI